MRSPEITSDGVDGRNKISGRLVDYGRKKKKVMYTSHQADKPIRRSLGNRQVKDIVNGFLSFSYGPQCPRNGPVVPPGQRGVQFGNRCFTVQDWAIDYYIYICTPKLLAADSSARWNVGYFVHFTRYLSCR